MWLRFSLLLLCGPIMVLFAHTTCILYELPMSGECSIEIDWRVHNDKQALATCLEYFPTTFVKGEKSGEKTKCTVKAAYTCVNEKHTLMYDKCYSFKDSSNAIIKKKISEYIKVDSTTNKRKECPTGKLAAVYSSTHAKFLGMKAHREGIDKLGIGMTFDGKTIDEENGEKSMLHTKLWMLKEGDYWDGEKLVKDTGDAQNKAKYLFMRTRTNHIYNRVQGSFERATENVEVTFACEVPAVFTEQQKWYCDKLGKQGLGLDTVYDDKSGSPRCLYVTAGKYTFNGDFADTKNIKGCLESPSILHSAGMDDGTAHATFYSKFQTKGKLRLAGTRIEQVSKYGADFIQEKCKGPITNSGNLENVKRQWILFDHRGKKQYPASTQLRWEHNYPLAECSDFPGKTTTIGLRDGSLIDLNKEVRARAVCSMRFFQECENREARDGVSPCGTNLVCTNSKEFVSDTKGPIVKEGFFKCSCPGINKAHDEVVENGKLKCIWKGNTGDCAWLKFHKLSTDGHNEEAFYNPSDNNGDFITKGRFGATANDKLQKVVVKEGCMIKINSKRSTRNKRADLTDWLKYGEHQVPNKWDESLGGDAQGWGASSAECRC